MDGLLYVSLDPEAKISRPSSHYRFTTCNIKTIEFIQPVDCIELGTVIEHSIRDHVGNILLLLLKEAPGCS